MKTADDVLKTLKGELEFLEQGGYERPLGHRQPLFCMETGADWKKPEFFEDSPSCPKKRYCGCDYEGDCVLLGFVPIEQRHEQVPCRHIPLNADGDTIESLEKAGVRTRTEAVLKSWLTENIEKLEARTPTV